MKTAQAWRVGHVSDPGLARTTNEDRVLVDQERGVFLVVDGLGGHAAGEIAAETAVRVINQQIASLGVDAEPQIRRAIAEANNRVYELAQTNEAWSGMACVLTLAVVQDDQLIVGHVGDTRLYLVWNGNLRKITPDHSPVGEQEDDGALTAEEAMRHPRRNIVFRDVGSALHQPDDANFIDVKRLPLRPDAALLLCSDGLSDVLTSSEMNAVIELYDGEPGVTAQQLVKAANEAGGKDNISVIFVAGPDFLGSQSKTLLDTRPRHAVTRPAKGKFSRRQIAMTALLLLIGMILGMLLWAALEKLTNRTFPPRAPATAGPKA